MNPPIPHINNEIRVEIEEAKHGEKSTVVAITLAAYSEYEKESGPVFWTRYLENIRESILNNSLVTTLVARDKGTIKGSVLLCEPNSSGAFKNNFPEMRLLAVPREFRNLGIANLLIEACESRAASSGVLTLHTTALMKTAKAMYERRGYKRYPEIDFEPTPGFFVWGYKKVLSAPFSSHNLQGRN